MMESFIQSVKNRLSTFGRLLSFLWSNKMWWMIPMIVVLVLFFVLLIAAQSTPLGPFIYTLI